MSMIMILVLIFTVGLNIIADRRLLVSAEIALLENEELTTCVAYNPKFQQLPRKLSDATALTLVSLLPDNLCQLSTTSQRYKSDIALAAARGNCTFSEKGLVAQSVGAGAVLIVSTTPIESAFTANQTADYLAVNISVLLIYSEDFTRIKNGSTFRVYDPVDTQNIWLTGFCFVTLTFVVIAVGAAWSADVYLDQLKVSTTSADGETNGSSPTANKESPITLLSVVILVFLMCGILLLLYFFYIYVVYLMMALFCIWSVIGFYRCSWSIIRRIPGLTVKIPTNDLPLLRTRPAYAEFLLIAVGIGLAALWLYIRNDRFGWILQDTLAVCFCISALTTVRLPNLKIATALLVATFIYDIFFVFVTKLFTKDGESIMVAVASGGGGSISGYSPGGKSEVIPLVFTFPSFGSLLVSCKEGSSLLGFGDVLIPGFFITFLSVFDLRVGSRKIYSISALVAYEIGLILTFVAMVHTKVGQPALMYIVPCLLITALAVGYSRHEVKQLWRNNGPMCASMRIRLDETAQVLQANRISSAPLYASTNITEPLLGNNDVNPTESLRAPV